MSRDFWGGSRAKMHMKLAADLGKLWLSISHVVLLLKAWRNHVLASWDMTVGYQGLAHTEKIRPSGIHSCYREDQNPLKPGHRAQGMNARPGTT